MTCRQEAVLKRDSGSTASTRSPKALPGSVKCGSGRLIDPAGPKLGDICRQHDGGSMSETEFPERPPLLQAGGRLLRPGKIVLPKFVSANVYGWHSDIIPMFGVLPECAQTSQLPFGLWHGCADSDALSQKSLVVDDVLSRVGDLCCHGPWQLGYLSHPMIRPSDEGTLRIRQPHSSLCNTIGTGLAEATSTCGLREPQGTTKKGECHCLWSSPLEAVTGPASTY
jgi:hypothetical protein